MLIQIYAKNEPLSACDLLIAKDDAVLSVPVAGLQAIRESGMVVGLVKPTENLAMKAAVMTARAIASCTGVASPVYVQCPDKAILDGVCSVEYADPDGNLVICAPAPEKPAAAARSKAKGKASGSGKKPEPKPAPQQQESGAQPAQEPAPAPDTGAGPGGAGDGFVKDGEVDLGQPDPPAPKPDPSVANAPKVMGILKECGVPSGQIPGVLEALREAADPDLTFPVQVKLKLAKDGAAGGMGPEKTADLVKPRFEELRTLLKEIDDANAAKA